MFTDGFSTFPSIIAYFPDLSDVNLSPHWNMAASLAENSPTVLLYVDSGNSLRKGMGYVTVLSMDTLHAREKGVWQHCVQRVVPNSGMWRDQSDRSICNQIAIIIYSRIINICVFFLLSSCSTSTEDLLIYSRSVCGKDDKTIRRTDGKQK